MRARVLPQFVEHAVDTDALLLARRLAQALRDAADAAARQAREVGDADVVGEALAPRAAEFLVVVRLEEEARLRDRRGAADAGNRRRP